MISRYSKRAALAAIVLSAGLASAQAAPILSFGQTSTADTITGATNAADTATTISGSDIAVTLSQYAGGGSDIPAYLTVSLASVSAASGSFVVTQAFSGMISFTSGIGGTGTNYLSATYTDFVFGIVGGSSLVLSATEPPGSVSFTSSILSQSILQDPKALSLGFADVTGPVSVVGSTLAGFSSTISGSISAATVAAVPEPASMTIFAAGLVATAFAFGRRQPRV